VDDYGLPMLKI